MKIIMVDSLTGNDYSICLCEKLHELGTDIHLVVPENREIKGNEKFTIKFLSPSKDKDKLKIRKFFQLIKFYIDFYKYIIQNNPDAVHYQFFRRKIGIIFYKLLKIKNINLIHTAHNVLPHEKNKIDYFLKSIVYKNSKFIIVHSTHIKEKLLKSFSVETDKVKIIAHGNFDTYLPKENIDLVNSRVPFKLAQSDNVILFFGYIREYKGLDLLLDAFELSAANDSNLRILIGGFLIKKLERFYLEKINQSKFKSRIIFHSRFIPKEEIPKYFSASDVVVLPYKRIDHSGIVHLAYSFSKPVIATNVGDFSEVIENNKSGILLNDNSVSELSRKINEAFKDKSSLKEMGKYAKSLSDTKYSWSDIARETIKVYDQSRS